MEIFNIIFTILIVCTFGLQRNSEGLSLQTCNVLKGMSILAVFVGHTSKLFTGFVLYKLYCSIGLFAVSLFFFISGYGLMYGYMHKENCTAGFARKRIVPILVAYLIACIIHYLLNGHQIVNIQSLILCAYVPFSWFIFSIISLYIMFLLSVSISKKSKMAEGGGNSLAFSFYTYLFCNLFVIRSTLSIIRRASNGYFCNWNACGLEAGQGIWFCKEDKIPLACIICYSLEYMFVE